MEFSTGFEVPRRLHGPSPGPTDGRPKDRFNIHPLVNAKDFTNTSADIDIELLRTRRAQGTVKSPEGNRGNGHISLMGSRFSRGLDE